MTLRQARHQKSGQPERYVYEASESRSGAERDEVGLAGHLQEGSGPEGLLQQVLRRENMIEAWKRVKANKGAAGIDGRSIEQTEEYLKTQWPQIREDLLQGRYRPQAVRRVGMPKPGGGIRELGIPTVIDRLIQQALLQILQPLIDPTFSEYSYGFRPRRSAQDAVKQAERYVKEGFQVVVDVDLEKFFDKVNHDILMERLSRRINDKPVLRLVRRYLQAGIMTDGVARERVEGTPQGGPLSPLLANVLLDEVDKELEKRGHRFARYADDCNVYVRSQRAGERVLSSLRFLYAKLKLKVNESKTAVGTVYGRKFLGYCFRRWTGNTSKIAVAPKALETFKQRIRKITRRVGGKGMTQITEQLRMYIPGWKAYFCLARTPKTFRNLDSWIRHRLRAILLKQWRRGSTIYRKARSLGANHETALKASTAAGHWWHGSQSFLHLVLTNEYFDSIGIPRLA